MYLIAQLIDITFVLMRDILRTFATDTACKLYVLGHDGNTLGMDRAQVGVLEESNKVGLGCLLQCEDSRTLEGKVTLEVLCNFPHETLEGQLADEKIGRLLVPTDFTKGNSSWAVPVGLLHSSGGRCRLTSCLGGELFAWGLASGGLACGLLGTGYC